MYHKICRVTAFKTWFILSLIIPEGNSTKSYVCMQWTQQPEIRLLIQQRVQVNTKKKHQSVALLTLDVGGSTGDRWIPLTKGQ